VVIPHGIPDVPFVDPSFYKDQLGLQGRKVLLTFGLISPGKGIEYVIEALPRIVQKHPDVTYVILGATHPHVYRREGDAYLMALRNLVEKCGVADHVAFHTRYVETDELQSYLGGADIYLTPYPNREQISSGTLAYALGTGKAVISTPYWYAEEMLAEGRGILVPFRDSAAITDSVCSLLDDDVARNAMRKRAYMATRQMVWKEVGRQYLQIAGEVVAERQVRPRPVFHLRAEPSSRTTLPDVNLSHLRTLTDATGIFQHAINTVPDRLWGYTTDDNARAAVVLFTHYDLFEDDSVLPLATTYLSFLHAAFDPDTRRFRNFLTYERRWNDDGSSDDVQGRSLWALGLTAARSRTDGLLSFAARLFSTALPTIESVTSPRAWAFAIIGIDAYLTRFPGDSFARRVFAGLAERLYDAFVRNASSDWPWCEDVVTYDNGKLPHALLTAGRRLSDPRIGETGLRTLEWLASLQADDTGVVSLIGNQGWMTREGHRARFDQQPVEAMALVEACAEAYEYTGNLLWERRARRFFGWFLGNNDTQTVLYDASTGGCRDGLHPHGANLNEGAESTLAWLSSLLTLHRLQRITPHSASSPASSGQTHG